MAQMFVVDSVGRSGELVLLWREGYNVVIQNYSRRDINALVKMEVGGVEWKLTGFYGMEIFGDFHMSKILKNIFANHF